jgi:cholesterol oxidase
MQTRDSTLNLSNGLFGLRTQVEKGSAPSAFIPEAQDLAWKFAKIVHGKPLVLPTESLFGIPTTAHILGGACMGKGPEEGVIDKDHKVFGYENLFVIDGSAISANPGVNPSLTISALAERASEKIIGMYLRTPE